MTRGTRLLLACAATAVACVADGDIAKSTDGNADAPNDAGSDTSPGPVSNSSPRAIAFETNWSSDPYGPNHAIYVEQVLPTMTFEPQRVALKATDAREPAYSPDGKRLAFVSWDSGVPQIYVHDFVDGTETQVTHLAHGAHVPTWSPKGSLIAFLATPIGFRREGDRDGGSMGKVESQDDGTKAAAEPVYADGSADLYVIAPDGTGQRDIAGACNSAVSDAWFPTWYPATMAFSDEKTILFACPSTALHAIQTDGSGLRSVCGGGDWISVNGPDVVSVELVPGHARIRRNAWAPVGGAAPSCGATATLVYSTPDVIAHVAWDRESGMIAYDASPEGEPAIRFVSDVGGGVVTFSPRGRDFDQKGARWPAWVPADDSPR